MGIGRPFQPAITDQGGSDPGEGQEVFRFAFIATMQAATPGQPRNCPLHGPTVAAQTLSNNLPAGGLLTKCGFQLSGVDTRRRSNHDLVKEAVTLFWYAALD